MTQINSNLYCCRGIVNSCTLSMQEFYIVIELNLSHLGLFLISYVIVTCKKLKANRSLGSLKNGAFEIEVF